MRFMGLAVFVSLAVPQVLSAQTAPVPAAPVAASKFSIASKVGELLADPEAKAVLMKHIPEVASSDQISMAADYSLEQIAQYPQANIDKAKLAAIQVDLSKIK